MKKVICSSARQFVCGRCTDVGDGTDEPLEGLCDEEETEDILLLRRRAEC